MDAENLQSGDSLMVTIYKTLDECKAVVPVLTRGFAQSLWCMRELYFATFNKSVTLHPVVIEGGWERGKAGGWLEAILSQFKVHVITNPSDVSEVARISSEITQVAMTHNCIVYFSLCFMVFTNDFSV